MRGFVREFSSTRIDVVMLSFKKPLCKNCGRRFEPSSTTTANGSGRRKLYCDDCNCNCGGECMWGECGVYERNNKKRLVRDRTDLPASLPGAVALTIGQRLSGLTSPAEIDRTEVVAEIVFERCGNPKCKKRTFCIRDKNQHTCFDDESCHKPAWIQTSKKQFCCESCRKQFNRNRN